MYDLSTQVLVVDDMLTMRKIMMKACRDIGFTNLVDAADGVKAWEILNSTDNNIGLVVSDWSMPNCTGLDLLKRVRGDGRFKFLPFVLITAESEGTQVAEALRAGVDNYIIKPFTAEILRVKLEEAQAKTSKRAA